MKFPEPFVMGNVDVRDLVGETRNKGGMSSTYRNTNIDENDWVKNKTLQLFFHIGGYKAQIVNAQYYQPY